jgi:predicted nucleotidyltransferase
VVAFGSRARGDGRADSDLDLAVISALPKLEPAGLGAGSI